MQLCSIASGSSGNCIYAGTDNTHILIDAGISGKRIEAGLNEIGLKGGEINGILVTHEHSDHIKSLGVLARKHGIPLYATKGTIDYINNNQSIGKVDADLYNIVEADHEFSIGDMTIGPIKISHDAAEPVAYILEQGAKKAGIVTDLGKYDEYIVDKLKSLDVLLLEANHDVKMLEVGPYPYYLKRRILGDRGHLSNELSGQLLSQVLHDNMKRVLLGHLSKENNFPELAAQTVKLEITQSDTPYKADDFDVSVAGRDFRSSLISF